jgi:hypothetical protein
MKQVLEMKGFSSKWC